MVKRTTKAALFWASALYAVIAVSFGFGYSTHMACNGKDDPTVTVESVQAALSWPWYVVQAVERLS